MTKNAIKIATRHLGTAALLAASLLMTACTAANNPFYYQDYPGPYAADERYPIKVKKAPGTNKRVAVTEECGDWSENLAFNPDQRPYPNMGCAVQNNLAAMVANPEDFVKPRAMTPALASNRSAAIDVYNDQPNNAITYHIPTEGVSGGGGGGGDSGSGG